MPDVASAETPEEVSSPVDLEAVARNIVVELQAEPQRYKLFGVWWWPVKSMLKLLGYGPDQLPMLGDYVDEGVAALCPPEEPQEAMRSALDEYQFNASFGHPGGLVETPDGELVTILDHDAGL